MSKIELYICQHVSPSSSFRYLEGLKKFRALAGEESCEPGILVCRVPVEQPLPFGVTALPRQDFPAWLKRRIA